MICPKCGADNNWVYDSFDTRAGNRRRYRRCNVCDWKFRTIEYYVKDAPAVGAKKGAEKRAKRTV